MASELLSHSILPSEAYNRLPCISEVADVPDSYASQLTQARWLLAKHCVPSGVSVRLVHRHFDALDGEAFRFKTVETPQFGRVLVMRPVLAAETPRMFGLNFFVDGGGKLQAYEYSASEVTNMSGFSKFLSEFRDFIVHNQLQHKLGLKLGNDWDVSAWSEFEFPTARSTFILPKGLPAPKGDNGVSTVTEWKAPNTVDGEMPASICVLHVTTCVNHCHGHSKKMEQERLSKDEWILGGEKIEKGSTVHSLISSVVEVW